MDASELLEEKGPTLGRPAADRIKASLLRGGLPAIDEAALAALPGNVAIAADIAGLIADSVVNVTQIATIDRTALDERIGALPDWLSAQVDVGLARALALALA